MEVLDALSKSVGQNIELSLWIAGTLFWVLVALLIGKVLFTFVKNWWLDYIQDKFVKKINWVLLELRFPKGNLTFPKAMEQVFASFYQIYSFGIKPEKKWLEGQVEEWISAEMVSSKDGIRFFIRVNKNFRNLVEAAIFAQYPEAEIIEADHDYINDFPPDLPNDKYDILGADMILGKANPYPITTYPYFFGERKYEEQEIDPIATLAEAMSVLKDDERIWVQILVSPDGGKLEKESKALLKKLSENKEEAKKKTFGESTYEFTKALIEAPVRPPVWSEQKPPEKKPLASFDSDVIKAVAHKASKLAFETMIRVIYIDSKDSFTKSNFAAVTSSFQQFNTKDLNFLRPAALTFTKSPRFLFKKSTLLRKKKAIYRHYIKRVFSMYSLVEETTPVSSHYNQTAKPFYMNVEELATIYHPPIMKVAASGLRSLEAKKGVPPANLPIEE
jgi:hypothetical protein